MEQTQQFPTEEVTLPSKGLLYPEGSLLKKGVIEMKYMTAREEDILTNQNLIQNGTVIDKLLQSLIVTPCDYNELLIGDKNAILVAARILGYGQDYTFKYTNPNTGEEEDVTVDLTKSNDKVLDDSLIINGKNEFEFTLPTSKISVTFKFLTQNDENKIANELKGLKKINKGSSSELTTRMKYLITSVNGDYEKKTIREFVDGNFLARDARALRDYISKSMPDIDLTYDIEFEDGTVVENITLPISVNFFWPDAAI
jgi:hypothetical protein|tara:strand:- start:3343 stop:4110 length:768 start_codon:yes stop_codon:yes gene_type:complete